MKRSYFRRGYWGAFICK